MGMRISAPAILPEEEEGDRSTMTFQDFDQAEDRGWRAIAKRGDFTGAARAITDYLASKSALEDWQIRILHFHAAQMYAFAGAVEEAPGGTLSDT